jgi:hypothetical protein
MGMGVRVEEGVSGVLAELKKEMLKGAGREGAGDISGVHFRKLDDEVRKVV